MFSVPQFYHFYRFDSFSLSHHSQELVFSCSKIRMGKLTYIDQLDPNTTPNVVEKDVHSDTLCFCCSQVAQKIQLLQVYVLQFCCSMRVCFHIVELLCLL